METEIIWLLGFLISTGIMVSGGRNPRDAPVTALGTIGIVITGWQLVNTYSLTYGSNSTFAIIIGIFFFMGFIKVIDALLK